MTSFSISEVEEMTGVKQHILRYWEDNIPFLNPVKDSGGRRVYSSRDVQIIMRIKHLVQEKKFTVEGASEQIIFESTKAFAPDTTQAINQIRNELMELYTYLHKRKEEFLVAEKK